MQQTSTFLTPPVYLAVAINRALHLIVLAVIILHASCSVRNPEDEFKARIREGAAYLDQGEYDAALSALQAALAIKKDNLEVLLLICKANAQIADFPQALKAVETAMQAHGDSLELRQELAKLQLLSGNLSGAEESAKKLLDAWSQDAMTHVIHGDVLVLQHQLEQAVDAYEMALSISPTSEIALMRLANCQLVLNREDLAAQTYQRLLSLQPSSPEILEQMAKHLALRNDFAGAEKLYVKATDAAPTNLCIQRDLAQFYLANGKTEQAEETLRHVLAIYPKSRSFKKLLIEVLLMRDGLPEAYSILMDLLTNAPSDTELLLLKGKYHLTRMESIQAVSCFEKAANNEPNMPAAHYLLGISYISLGQYSLAENSLIQALALDPFFSDAELALVDLYYKKEDLDLSKEHTQRVLERERTNFRAQMMMGNILLAKSQYDKAEAQFESAQKLNPSSPSPIFYLALTAELAQKKDLASKYYEQLLELSPTFADARLRYVRLLLKSGQLDKARRFLENPEFVKNADAFYHYTLGELLISYGSPVEALSHFKRSITMQPMMISAYGRLLDSYDIKAGADERILLLEACVEKAPQMPEGYALLAEAYEQKAEWDKAEAILNTGISRCQDSAVLTCNLAWLKLERGEDVDQALALALKAYSVRAEDPAVLDTLGWAYYKKNMFTRAVWMLAEAQSLEPEHPLVNFHLGMAFHANGDESSAAKTLQKSLSLGLGVPQQDEARSTLNAITRNKAIEEENNEEINADDILKKLNNPNEF